MKKTRTRKYIVRTKSGLARLLGVGITTIDKWRARGMPGEPLKWDLAEVLPWYRNRTIEEAHKIAEKRDPKRRLDRYKTQLCKLKVEVARGKYVPKDVHIETLRVLATSIRSRLLAMAASLPGQLTGLEPSAADELVKDRVWELLEDLSSRAGEVDGEKDAGDSPGQEKDEGR